MVRSKTKHELANKWFWFSFSYKGKSQGCCNVQAKDEEAALQKTIDLCIHPKHDDIDMYVLDEPELEPDKLFTREEMIEKEYSAEKGWKIK